MNFEEIFQDEFMEYLDDEYVEEKYPDKTNDILKSDSIINDIKKYTKYPNDNSDLDIKQMKSNIETLLQIRKLEKIREALGNSDPKEKENEYFSKYNCFSEKQKIELEAKFIKTKILKDKDKYIKDYQRYYLDLKIVDNILSNLDLILNKDLDKIKQCLIIIELDLNIDVALVSEVDEVYKLKIKKMENDTKKKKEL